LSWFGYLEGSFFCPLEHLTFVINLNSHQQFEFEDSPEAVARGRDNFKAGEN